MKINEEEDEYEVNVKNILEDLIFHTIKNSPKNIVSIIFFIIFNSLNIW